jgi:hypothetical protein
MSYGIEIKNIYGEIILDNTPFSVMRVLDGYPTTAPAGTSKYDEIFACTDGEVVFVRSTDDGAVGGAGTYEKMIGGIAASSTLTYVKLKSCENLTATGYGLAVFSNEGTPKLVFSDSMKFVKFVFTYTGVVGESAEPLAMKFSIPLLSEGMHRYVSVSSFGMCNTKNTDNWADVLKMRFGVDSVYIYSERVTFREKTFAANVQFPISITVIEC